MGHGRQQLRDAITLLVTGLATTGARVYVSRRMPLDDDNLPGLLIDTPTEEIVTPEEYVDRTQVRNLTVDVKGYDKIKAGVDDQLDDIAAEVETAVFAADIDGVYGLDLISTEIEIYDGAEQDIGEIILTFQVQYITEQGAPETLM